MITATRYLDAFEYYGERCTTTQALKWPRKDYKVDGVKIDCTYIPQQVKNATFELAHVLLYKGEALVGTTGTEGILRPSRTRRSEGQIQGQQPNPRRHQQHPRRLPLARILPWCVHEIRSNQLLREHQTRLIWPISTTFSAESPKQSCLPGAATSPTSKPPHPALTTQPPVQ